MLTLAPGPARAIEASVLLPRESTAFENLPTYRYIYTESLKKVYKLYSQDKNQLLYIMI